MVKSNAINASSAGLQVMDSSGTRTGVTLTGIANQISVANGDGTAANPIPSLTSTIRVSGISFNSGANTLSNYAVGTFAPTITASTSNPTITYGTQLGRYTRVGNRVFYNIKISFSAYSGGSGDIQFDSLPFTNNLTTANFTNGSISPNNISFGANVKIYNVRANPNTTFLLAPGNRDGVGLLNLRTQDVTVNSILTISTTAEI